jgi:hypothetical protein
MKAILKTRRALNLISTFLFHLDSTYRHDITEIVFVESYPYYVTEYKFGIVAGDIRAELVKVPRTGMFLALIFVKGFSSSQK